MWEHISKSCLELPRMLLREHASIYWWMYVIQVKSLVEDLGENARPRMQAAIAAEVQVCWAQLSQMTILSSCP